MKERPILFSAPMVRALLDGSKTQTRRIMKPQPDFDTARASIGRNIPDSAACYDGDIGGVALREGRAWAYVQPNQHCPYGQPGDQLWVKETTVNVEDHGYVGPVYAESYEGRGAREYGLSPTPDDMIEVEPEDIKLRPSLFMSRTMSRITLEIVSVRVEHLQDISEADVLAEGCTKNHNGYFWGGPHAVSGLKQLATAEDAYRDLWESINGAGAWDANPWVWVLDFKKVTP